MDDIDLRLKMLANIPIYLENAGEVFIPTLREIAEMGLGNYNQRLSFLLIDRANFEHNFDESISNFDLFYVNCDNNPLFRQIAFQALELFFHVQPGMAEDQEKIYITLGENRILDHSNFPLFQNILYLANHLKKASEPNYNPVNSKAQEMINLIIKTRKKRPKPREQMNLESIVSGLAWKQNGISLSELFELNIYQIYRGFYTTNNIDHYHLTLTGIYAGTLDGKTVKMSDIHWANKIQF